MTLCGTDAMAVSDVAGVLTSIWGEDLAAVTALPLAESCRGTAVFSRPGCIDLSPANWAAFFPVPCSEPASFLLGGSGRPDFF